VDTLLPFTLDHFIRQGMLLAYIEEAGYPYVPYQNTLDAIDTYLVALKAGGFPCPEEPFRKFQEEVREAVRKDPEIFATGLSIPYAEKLKQMALPVRQLVLEEAKKRHVLTTDGAAFSEAMKRVSMLQELEKGLADERLKTIAGETVRCLAAGAYRAAIVMGWNLTYEFLRQWLYDLPAKSRLDRFNAVLTTKYRSRSQTYSAVTSYEDFFELGERLVLDTAYEADLFRKHHHQVLLNGLTDRNHFAHSSSRVTTPSSATGYIENLVANIIQDAHFR
jgi:hypothetical protein